MAAASSTQHCGYEALPTPLLIKTYVVHQVTMYRIYMERRSRKYDIKTTLRCGVKGGCGTAKRKYVKVCAQVFKNFAVFRLSIVCFRVYINIIKPS